MEELIDVLDENGVQIGKIETRKEIHKQGLWHRVILVAIIDKQGRMLMQQRAKYKEVNPNKWDISTAGHVSAGQTSKEAAIREVSEELGLNVKEDELKYVYTFKNGGKVKDNYISNHIYDFYIINKDEIKIEQIKMQESEVQQVQLCNKEQVQKKIDSKEVVERGELYSEILKMLR